MFAIVTTAKNARIPTTTNDDQALDPATTRRAERRSRGHRDDDADREHLRPAALAVGERRARVAPERDGDHRGDDGVRGVDRARR